MSISQCLILPYIIFFKLTTRMMSILYFENAAVGVTMNWSGRMGLVKIYAWTYFWHVRWRRQVERIEYEALTRDKDSGPAHPLTL